MRLPYLMGIAVPSTGHPDPIRGYAIHGCACRDTHKVLIDQCCCLSVWRMAPLQQCAVGARAAFPEAGDALVWERGPLARSRAYTKFARLNKAKW